MVAANVFWYAEEGHGHEGPHRPPAWQTSKAMPRLDPRLDERGSAESGGEFVCGSSGPKVAHVAQATGISQDTLIPIVGARTGRNWRAACAHRHAAGSAWNVISALGYSADGPRCVVVAGFKLGQGNRSRADPQMDPDP